MNARWIVTAAVTAILGCATVVNAAPPAPTPPPPPGEHHMMPGHGPGMMPEMRLRSHHKRYQGPMHRRWMHHRRRHHHRMMVPRPMPKHEMGHPMMHGHM